MDIVTNTTTTTQTYSKLEEKPTTERELDKLKKKFCIDFQRLLIRKYVSQLTIENITKKITEAEMNGNRYFLLIDEPYDDHLYYRIGRLVNRHKLLRHPLNKLFSSIELQSLLELNETTLSEYENITFIDFVRLALPEKYKINEHPNYCDDDRFTLLIYWDGPNYYLCSCLF